MIYKKVLIFLIITISFFEINLFGNSCYYGPNSNVEPVYYVGDNFSPNQIEIGYKLVNVKSSGEVNPAMIDNISKDNVELYFHVGVNGSATGSYKIVAIIVDNYTDSISDFINSIKNKFKVDISSYTDIPDMSDIPSSHGNLRFVYAVLDSVKIDNNSGKLSVTIPQGAKVYFKAYDKNGVAYRGYVENNIENGPVYADNGSVSFSPTNLINKIYNRLAQDGVVNANTTNSFDIVPQGTYEFAIGTNIPIGYYDNTTGNITCFDNHTADNYPMIFGKVKVTETKKINVNNPTEIEQPSETPTGGGGGGGEVIVPPTTTPEEAATDIEEATSADEVVNTVENLSESVSNQVEEALSSGDIDTATQVMEQMGDTITKALEKTTETAKDVTQAAEAVANIVDAASDTISKTIEAITKTENLKTEDVQKVVTEVESQAKDLINKTAEVLPVEPEKLTIEHTKKVVESASKLLTSVIKGAKSIGKGISEDVIKTAQNLSEKTLIAVVDDIAKEANIKIEKVTDVKELQSTLEQRKDLIDDVVEVAGVDITEGVAVNKEDLQKTLKNVGLSEDVVKKVVEALPEVADPESPVLAKGNEVIKTADVVENAVKDVAPDIEIKPTDKGTIEAKVGEANVAAFIAEVKIVPPAIPEGVHALPDGKVVSVKNGVAVVVTPAPKDPVPVLATLTETFENVNITKEGTVNVKSGNNLISGSFGWVVGGANKNAENKAQFEMVGNNPATEEFAVKVIYPDGSTQNIAPFISDIDNLVKDLDKFFGINYNINRDNGVLTVKVNNNTYKFKFSYITETMTSDDTKYYNSNKDKNGLAYKAGDFNSDGITDYKIYSTKGVQIIYGIK